MTLLSRVLELFFPSRCVFCRRLVPAGSCQCEACGKSLAGLRRGSQGQKLPHIAGVYAPFFYEDAVRDSLIRCKFRGENSYPGKYAAFLAKCIDENAVSCDIITWVPLSRKRLRRRGFDQAELMAEALAVRVGLPCERLLEKPRDIPAQSGMKTREQRLANAAGAYRAIREELISGRSILLVDDIITSGATVSECARMLLAAGAREVTAISMASGRR